MRDYPIILTQSNKANAELDCQPQQLSLKCHTPMHVHYKSSVVPVERYR